MASPVVEPSFNNIGGPFHAVYDSKASVLFLLFTHSRDGIVLYSVYKAKMQDLRKVYIVYPIWMDVIIRPALYLRVAQGHPGNVRTYHTVR